MTAQIAVMNKVAIALASDSAVTAQPGVEKKIFTSANKLFTLSDFLPVGVMVYGNADLMGVPWETIIKLYRSKLGNKSFAMLREYSADFLAFLEDSRNNLFAAAGRAEYVENAVLSYFAYLKKRIEDDLAKLVEEKGTFTERQAARIVSAVIDSDHRLWEKAPLVPTFSSDFSKSILDKHKSAIDAAIRKVFEQLSLSNTLCNKLRDIAVQVLVKMLPEGLNHESTSGIVIAGFGGSELFPKLVSFDVDGIVESKLRYWEHSSSINRPGDTTTAIAPFAQADMVVTFMEGANPFYRQVEDSLLSKILRYYSDEAMRIAEACGCTDSEGTKRLRTEWGRLRRKVKRNISNNLKDFRRSTFIEPILAVVGMLPKDDLAAMAESLVNLTKFQRRVSLQAETVGGAIDVAVISKVDGFVWIKRKFYFDPGLNPRFIAHYYKDVNHEEQNA